MAKIIDCGLGDRSSYYRDTLVVTNDKRVIQVQGVDDSNTNFVGVIRSESGDTVSQVPISDCSVVYPEPYFTESGEVEGVSTARSYKRAPSVSFVSRRGLWSRLNQEEPVLDLSKERSRIGWQYLVHTVSSRRKGRKAPVPLRVVEYIDGTVVGFVEEGKIHIKKLHFDRLIQRPELLGGQDVLVPANW